MIKRAAFKAISKAVSAYRVTWIHTIQKNTEDMQVRRTEHESRYHNIRTITKTQLTMYYIQLNIMTPGITTYEPFAEN